MIYASTLRLFAILNSLVYLESVYIDMCYSGMGKYLGSMMKNAAESKCTFEDI